MKKDVLNHGRTIGELSQNELKVLS